MRLSLFAVVFLLSSVYASPLVARPPTIPKSPAQPPEVPEPPAQAPVVKPPPKAPVSPLPPVEHPEAPKGPKLPPVNPPQEHGDEPGKGGEPGKQPPVKKPPPKKPCKKNVKRADDGPVGEAASNRGDQVGSGNTGDVFKTTFQGQDAVIKIIDASRPGGGPENVKKEVTNLKTVGQLLAWGEEKPKGNNPGRFFVVMPNMGVRAPDTKLPDAEIDKLMKEAQKNYLEKYHMENRDKNPANYVFRQVDGKWQGEIVDWARAIYTGKDPQPDAGAPETVQDSTKCTVM